MQDIVIEADNLGKTYQLGRKQARYQTLRESITDFSLAPLRRLKSMLHGNSAAEFGETIWALKNVSFEIKKGEIVGVIGRNGAGKSTLLKILTSITEPTEGRAKITGRVGSLLEVGTGFHPELTGRENIYLNGAILGMKRSEINNKFDEIVAFAELDKFIDTAVKHYSSGMYMRLAFAVAAHLETDILLVDEVLAVGDINFQHKCIKRMNDISVADKTIILVSHNTRVVESLAGRCIYLKNGIIDNIGRTADVIEQYQKDALSNIKTSELPVEFDKKIVNPPINFLDFTLLDGGTSKQTEYITPETPVIFSCVLASNKSVGNLVICLRIYRDKQVIAGNNSYNTYGILSVDAFEKYKLTITIDEMRLIPGKYTAVIFALPDYYSGIQSVISNFNEMDFLITGSKNYGGGYVYLNQNWNIKAL